MPSVIILSGPITDPGNIAPADEPALLRGMKKFGAYHKQHYDPTDVDTAAESLKKAFVHVISEGCHIYYWSKDSTKFIEITNPTRTGSKIDFTEDHGGHFKIQVHLDDGSNNPKMNVTLPVSRNTDYLNQFNRLAADDFNGNPSSTNFFAAAILISRCK